MGSTDGLPDMRMYGSTAPPTASQVLAAGRLIRQTGATLARYQNVQAAFAAGYTYVLRTNGEEHLLYDGPDPAYAGLDRGIPPRWSTRSTCRITRPSCSARCTSRTGPRTARRSADR